MHYEYSSTLNHFHLGSTYFIDKLLYFLPTNTYKYFILAISVAHQPFDG